jgi:hypothetical protein
MLDNPWFKSQQRQEVSLFSKTKTAAARPAQAAIQWVLGPLSLAEREGGKAAWMPCRLLTSIL